MSKKNKVLLGILTFLPFIGIFLFFAAFLSFLMAVQKSGAPDSVVFSNNFIVMFGIVGFLALLSLGLMIYYIIHAVNNRALSSDERIVWIILFVFLSNIAFVIYWIIKVLNVKEIDNKIFDNHILDDKI